MGYMFASCNNINSLNITMFNIDNCKDFTNMFENDEKLELYFDVEKCDKLKDTLPDYISIHNVPTMTPMWEIKCYYDVVDEGINTLILGKDFIKNSKFNIYI